jgi:cold shock CspA family protein
MCKGNADTSADSNAADAKASKRATEPAVVGEDAELFAGVVKSYNERRGFGFLACDETAKRYGRDVYLSKVESQSALKDDDDTLKEGDHVVFAVVPSEEGFPQAAAVQRLHLVQGTVLSFCKQQGGIVALNADAGVPGTSEVVVKASDCGCLELFPGDEISFCIESAGDGVSIAEAKLLRLLKTCRPPCALLSCFNLVFPRLVPNEQHALYDVVLSGHAFGTCICLSGLPADLGELEVSKLFGRFGVTQVTVVHSRNSSLASIQFPDVTSVARFLTGTTHAFTDQSSTKPLVAQIRKNEAPGAESLPALSAPSMVAGDSSGVLICWEPLNLAASYTVEIRTVGAEGWSPVDCVGRVQPAGAAASLPPQQSCLAVAGLTAGAAYEARVSYLASCGCAGAPSDPSVPCMAGWPNAAPMLPSALPTDPALGYPQAHTSMFASSPCSQLQTASMQMHGAVSAHTVQPAPAPQQMPYSFYMPETAPQYPSTCEAPVHLQPGTLQATGSCPILPPPRQPELRIAGTGTAVSAHWHSVGPYATSYVVELRENATAASNRFVRIAPEGMCALELCIQGLVPGRSYTVCVRGVGKDGIEGPPSTWSAWLTLPLTLQPYDMLQCGNMAAHCMPPMTQHVAMAPDTLLQKPHELPEKPAGAQPTVSELAPEVTGQEVLFLD